MTRRLLFIVFAGMAAVAQAQQPITIAQTIPYASDAVGDADIRSSCDWNTQFSSMIVKAAKGSVTATDKDLSQVSGRVLVLTITAVHSLGGGGYTGPKWADVHGELRDGSTNIGHYDTSARTIAGSVTSCKTLLEIGKALAERVAEWAEISGDDPMALLQSEVPAQVRQGARDLYHQSDLDRATLDAVAARLSRDETTKDPVLVDGLAWLCRVLEKSGQARYRALVQHVADSAADDKLRKYAAKSAQALPIDASDLYVSPAAAPVQ